jgi:prepilin-type N-terminal cleavage/methylation domain-containing protein
MKNDATLKFLKQRIARRQRGFTLIEVLAALVIVSILTLAIYMAVSTSTKVLVLTNNQETAKDIAASDMEYIRSVPYSGAYIILNSSTGAAKQGNPVTFTVNVTNPTATDPVTFYDSTNGGTSYTVLGTGIPSTGQTAYTTSALSNGTHTIKAVYKNLTAFATVVVSAAGPATTTNAPNPSDYVTSIAITFLRTNEQRIDITVKWGGQTVFTLTDFRASF